MKDLPSNVYNKWIILLDLVLGIFYSESGLLVHNN